MSNFISILLALCLSSVTTSTACSMDALSELRSDCHCPHLHDADATGGTEPQSAVDGCCDVVMVSAIDAQQPGIAAAAPALDWPVMLAVPLHTVQFVAPILRKVVAPPPLHGPPGKGSRTYLTTARLRL